MHSIIFKTGILANTTLCTKKTRIITIKDSNDWNDKIRFKCVCAFHPTDTGWNLEQGNYTFLFFQNLNDWFNRWAAIDSAVYLSARTILHLYLPTNLPTYNLSLLISENKRNKNVMNLFDYLLSTNDYVFYSFSFIA